MSISVSRYEYFRLKITSRISTARDLILDKEGNKAVGLLVGGKNTVASGNTEIYELLERKSLKFSMLSVSVDSDVALEIIESQESASIFVCTKEFLLQHSELPKEKNPLTIELDSQIENILNNNVSPITIEGICSWQDIKTLKNALFTIKCSNIRNEEKDDFIITAYSLMNLIQTVIFPIERLNKALESGEFISRAIMPSAKLNALWMLADKPTELIDQFLIVADIIERLYHSVLKTCPKYEALMDLLGGYFDKRIAVVVPKAYHADMLKSDDWINRKCTAIETVNRFNSSEQYDVIIVAGDISGTHFNPLRCRVASDIIVLLYDGEERIFRHKKQIADSYERSINARLNLEADEGNKVEVESFDRSEIDEVASTIVEDTDLNQYINTLTSFDSSLFAQRVSGYSGNGPTSEVYAAGHFLTGEQILFTRYYQAVVFDEVRGTVSEKDVEELQSGDIIVFAKRDDHTRNMVDYIFDTLQQSGRFTEIVVEATEKSRYWKLALREYKEMHGLSYRELAKRLRVLGLSIQEVSIRQWLIEESHIVGPRDENTLVKIAELTQDPILLGNTHAYFESFEIVRKQRKNILKLIGKAIVDKLSGFTPTDDTLLEFIFNNVESLSESMELDAIHILDKQVTVSAIFTNKPIKGMEVTL